MSNTVELPARTGRNQGYDLLRIVSICAVVAIHTFGAIAANTDIRPSVSWALAVVFTAGSIWAVPVFVMLSGALTLTERAQSVGPLEFYAKRAKRIIPALIVWHLVYLVGVRMILLRQDFSAAELVESFISMTVYPHLYFLWLIAGLYIVAPVLAGFLRRGGRNRALIFAGSTLGATLLIYAIPGIVSLIGVSRPIQFEFLTIWLPYVGYFLAGYALSLAEPSRRATVWWAIAGFALAVIVMAQFAFPESLRILSAIVTPEYLGIGVALLSLSVFIVGGRALNRLTIPPWLSMWVLKLSEASFGVFLVHLIVLLLPYRYLQGFKNQVSTGEALLAYVIILILSFAISMIARKIPIVRSIF
jgi:surface polysaccharide O-acyltransferase-like enzyme